MQDKSATKKFLFFSTAGSRANTQTQTTKTPQGNSIRFNRRYKMQHKFCKFENQPFIMTEIVIDKKKYVLIPEKNYQALQKKAALKTKPEKTFTVEQARAYSKKMIRKWAGEK